MACGNQSATPLDNWCSTLCNNLAMCMPPADANCVAGCKGYYPPILDEVLDRWRMCLQQYACDGSAAGNCSDAVIASLPMRQIDADYNRACLTRKSACMTTDPNVLVKCDDTRAFRESFITNQYQPCLDVPCDQIQTCQKHLI
jgi:hypothetical protein